ncbi:NlpC/P60 family protein [Leucobacter soli]|nr:NlpC/P60 family protein [Leucobacter soli]
MVAPRKRSSSAKRIGQMVGAGVISAGLVGVFAFPAYATPETEELRFTTPVQQELVTADAEASVQTQLPEAKKEVVATPAVVTTTDDAAEDTSNGGFDGKDLPAGEGASGLVAAALAQVGDYQDCTAVVERALRAIGYSVGDLGTIPSQYLAYGSLVTSGGYAPGDILFWPGSHVAVYIGNGQAVHGGWNGSTVVAGLSTIHGYPSAVVRLK